MENESVNYRFNEDHNESESTIVKKNGHFLTRNSREFKG